MKDKYSSHQLIYRQNTIYPKDANAPKSILPN
jgi:hypothetical protein